MKPSQSETPHCLPKHKDSAETRTERIFRTESIPPENKRVNNGEIQQSEELAEGLRNSPRKARPISGENEGGRVGEQSWKEEGGEQVEDSEGPPLEDEICL